MRQLTAPRCHWGNCPSSDKQMFLLNENDDFWFFAHGCGCTRAVTKPAQRAASLYTKYQNDIDQQRRLTRYLEMKKEYSFPGGKP
jgi:hypothetical protein